MLDLTLLNELSAIHSPSGDETGMTSFLLDYVAKNKSSWKVEPEIFHGYDFQNCIVLVFGKPTTAVYAHIDSIGFTVRYNNELVRIGAPRTETGYNLVGSDSIGEIDCKLIKDNEGMLRVSHSREIDRGTALTFKPNWREDVDFVQCCYMDNRLGVFNALELCKELKNGAIVFSCWEEHGGGSVAYLAKFLFDRFGIRQSLISDITWVTEGVRSGKGVVISLRDTGIPRRVFVDKIISLAKESGVPFQLEVEGSGGSDGTELQKLPYPIDWCFIGAPEDFVHTPDEKVHKKDIENMISMYRYLMEKMN